jgi:peptidoglycan/xylan/chitin deacetylase (PgdA/CDA1 family)
MRIASLLFHDVYLRDPRESGFESAAADRYKLSLAEFDAQLQGIVGVRGRLPFVITVDDGGRSYYTVAADRLEALGWRGHCFVTTNCIGEPGFLTAQQIRELDARGHHIGSHSASHPARFSCCSMSEMRHEWTRSREALEDVLGHAVASASVPGGYFSMHVARTAEEAGIRVLFTSEPTTRVVKHGDCKVIGRFTVRPGGHDEFCARIVSPPARTRHVEWAGWNAKKLIKPLLGSTYARVADWLLASRP